METLDQHRPRATRAPGRKTRTTILDAATSAFLERGINRASLVEIAAAVECYPSQVTYYFGTKEALFVEAACRAMLHLGEDVERVAGRAPSAHEYLRRMVDTVLASPALPLFAEAMLIAGRRPELTEQVAATFRRLHDEGARAAAEVRRGKGWTLDLDPESEARTFWSLVLGVALEKVATGPAFDQSSATATVLLMLQPHMPPAGRGAV